MINLIRIMEDRSLLISSKVMGVVGENNAEILKFIFPKKINDINIPDGSLSYKILTENSTNGYVEYDLNNDEFSIPQELTSDETLSFAIGIFQNNSMIWKSFTYDLIFMPGQNTNAESIVRNAVLKLNYDRLYDALDEQDVELPEKSTSPTQADVDGLISIVENLDGESIRNAILSDIRGSFTENVGGNYSNKTIAEIIGTPGESGLIVYPSYHDGELYTIRYIIGNIAKNLDEEHLDTDALPTLYGSSETIRESLADIKAKVIATLNSILDPDELYDISIPWSEIKELVENLPNDVEIQTTSAVNDNSTSLRESVDDTISAIIAEYGLDVEIATGTWEATLSNLEEVTTAINQPYEDLISGMEEILGITEGDSDE